MRHTQLVASVLLLLIPVGGCSGGSFQGSDGSGGSGSGPGIGSGGSDGSGSGGSGSGSGSGRGGSTGTGRGGSSPGAGGALTSGAGGTTPQGGFSGTGSMVHGIFIPNGHPRLFWTPDRLTAAQAWWKSHSFAPSTSDGPTMNAFAYMMTGTAKYCQQAISGAQSFDLSDCTASKAGCDDSRYFGEDAVLTYDWCYPVMTDSQRTTYVKNWNTWLTQISMQSWGGPGMSQSNYYWGNVRNEAEWGIATYYENQTVAEQLLKDALDTRYTNDFVPASTKPGQGLGGLGLEGGQYGPYQGYYVSSILFPSMVAAGRDIFDETPYWKGTVLNRIYMTPPQKTVSAMRTGWDVFPFDDDETWQDGSPGTANEKGTFMTAAATLWAPSNIGKWARQWLAQVKPGVDPAAASVDPGGSSQDFSGLPLDYYNGGTRYLIGRNDWTANATSYMWQMGEHYSDGHEHADWGAFQINRKGRWLTRETVGYTESVPGYGGTGNQPLNMGLAHNVPLINGAAADGGNSSPTVTRLESQPGYAYAVADLSNAFGKSGVHVEREYWFIRDIETFVILDRLTATASQSRTFIFHCETNPTLVDTTHVKCVNGDQQLSVTTLLPAAPSSRTVVNESKASMPPPAANTQYRVEINDAPNASTSYTLHVLQAMDATGTALAPTVTDSASGSPTSGTLTVKLDGSHTLTLTKGMTSSGGSISIGGQSTELRANVEPFALDGNDVPTWGP